MKGKNIKRLIVITDLSSKGKLMYSTGPLAVNLPQHLVDLNLGNQVRLRLENIISDILLFHYHGDKQSIRGLVYKGGGKSKNASPCPSLTYISKI